MRIKAELKLTNWNGPRLAQRARFVFGDYCTQLFPKFQDSIVEVRAYNWPNLTIRKNGQLAEASRNIVDTGAFKLSQERTMLNATTCLFTWNVPYSSLILTGYTTKAGNIMPPRDWITPVLRDEFPMARFFENEWKRLGY
ncbi:MAG: hypothetical protein ACO28M_10085 [Vulcanococcus sp.]